MVNDAQLHRDIAEAAEGLNSLVGGITRLQTWVNLRSEFQLNSGAAKNYVQFTLQPWEDKAYIFDVVNDPRGVREVIIEDVETTSPDDGRAFRYPGTLDFFLGLGVRFNDDHLKTMLALVGGSVLSGGGN